MALFPSGLMDDMWNVLKRMDRMVVVLWDSPENILSRIAFYDEESKPLAKSLSEMELRYYLKEIKKDGAYFERSYRKADIAVDIEGLDVERSAMKIERLLRERLHARSRELSTLTLFQAIDVVRERVMRLPSSEKADVWSTILKQIAKRKSFEGRYAVAIEEIIRPLVQRLDDDVAIAMWRETEIGMGDDADDEQLVADSVRMDLEVELLEAVTHLAYEEAKRKTIR